MNRVQIARETVEILERGHYQAGDGTQVDLSKKLQSCIKKTACYEPDTLAVIQAQVLARPKPFSKAEFEVVNETTLSGAARLVGLAQHKRLGVLNFASAKNPGGGFLSGAEAQEESLARSSGLYHSLLQCYAFYNYHRAQKSALYSDRMIYSPGCPIFRQDDGALLAAPYEVDFITSPAPNAGALAQNEPENLDKIPATLRERSAKILALALHHGCQVLVLGAWGCGVFKNDPALVAEIFYEHLGAERPFWGRFEKVLFAVLDTTHKKETYWAFFSRFS
jgi:uncharacterized protein (TIGR02452 family)